jgi:putative transposase
MFRMFKYRIYPTKRQADMLTRSLEVCSELYNAALQERRDAWRLNRASVTFFDQSAQLTEVRKCRADVAEISYCAAENVLKRVDRAFKAFFRRVKKGDNPGHPRFKSVRYYSSLTFRKLGRPLDGNRLCIAKVGRVRIKLSRPLEGKIKELHVRRECEKWYAVFCVECEPKPLPACDTRVGIDVGIITFAAFDGGKDIENRRYYRQAQSDLRRAQRRLARRERNSNRWRDALLLLQKVHALTRRRRIDFHHWVSRRLVNNFGFIVVEDLKVKGLASGMLAKDVRDAGWASFFHKLAYKAESAGRVLVKVDPRGTSQRCVCGASVPKDLSQRRHTCGACGLDVGRDRAAAMEILRLGLSLQALT